MLNDRLLMLESSTEPVALAAIRALELFDNFDTSSQVVLAKLTAILDSLTALGILNSNGSDRAVILAMGDSVESWADQKWSGDVTLTDIANARSYTL